MPPPAGLAAIDRLPTDRTRTWLGPPYWANRLQDWRLHQGRVPGGPPGPQRRARRPGPQARGYGLVRVDKERRQFVIECWTWDGAEQFPGRPYRLPFPEV